MSDPPKALEVRVAELENAVKKLTEQMTSTSTVQTGAICNACVACFNSCWTCVGACVCEPCRHCSLCGCFQ